MELTRVKNDVNGNPRYVIHFLDLLTADEIYNSNLSLSQKFNIALTRSRQFGGKKYRGNDYGGGIVFQSYNTNELINDILKETL